jgi:ribonuclease D
VKADRPPETTWPAQHEPEHREPDSSALRGSEAASGLSEVASGLEASAPENSAPDNSAPDNSGPEAEPPKRDIIDLREPREGLPAVTSTPQALAEAVTRLTAGTGPVAVDAERASGYRYGQRAYLVQLRRAGAGTVLIDPVGCPDLSELDAALADVEAVLHAASQDLPCLAEIGYRPRTLFDTELAGRLLGYPRVALGTMLEEVLGFRLAKEHSAADWSIRPLSAEMLKYAALDVEVLTDLRDALAVQLAEQGKDEWARQEFAAIAAAPPPSPRPDPWRRTSGIHRVRSRRGLAIVRELWDTRDAIAQEADVSPRRILTDAAIIEAARLQPGDRAQLDRITGFSARHARRQAAMWLAAVRRACELPDTSLPDITGAGVNTGPPPAHRWGERDPDAAARLAAAREVVTTLSAEHGTPAENLISPDAVRRLSWEPPDPPDQAAIAAALADYGARPWQTGLIAGQIARAWAAPATPDSLEASERPEPPATLRET